jgi:osmotically inducible lipoprotein OsmB
MLVSAKTRRPGPRVALPLAALLLLGGCAGLTDSEQRVLTGAGAGAAAGTVIGALSGSTFWGAAIGTAVGAGGGFLVDQHKQSEQRAFNQGYRAGQASAAPPAASTTTN